MKKLLEYLISFQTDRNHPREIKRCFDFVVSHLKKSGLKIKTYSSNNKPSLVAARKLKKHYQYILNGHLDVVPANYKNAFKPTIKKNKLYGRGAGDMKGTVAAMIELIKDSDLKKRDLALMLTSDEEVGGFDGVNYLLKKQNYFCDCAIVPDGGENFQLVLAEKGVLHVKFEAQGKAAHGSRPWLGDNAVNKLIRIYERISQAFPQLTAPDYWHPTINLGVLKGGEATNIVPNQAIMQLDFRFPDVNDEKKILKLIKKETKKENEVKFEIIARGYPLINDPKNIYFRKISNCAKRLKINLKPVREHGASDGRFFSEKGIPVIMFKPICSESHIENEWVDLESLEKFLKLLKNFLLS